ncbi:NfeD-like protein [Kovacikia minuta CCNUW1]|uniref:NfeD-like protein n=1 Tax=Kovacikia minuta TaxID=2931930 RepID=UPI001CCD0A11|nr:NfeD-like protein [Kovacikia minuta]UBF27211.1 NfeD-like protein [Kovacikia minuta CCNUW1]
MLSVYWFCFAIGGVFVLLAVLGGFDGVDFDTHDFDFHSDADFEVVDPGDRAPLKSSAVARSPKSGRFLRSLFGVVKSLKFWTFGSCFFGLTGIVLSSLQLGLPPLTIAILAVGMGILCGAGISGALLSLRRQQTDSLVRTTDLVGLIGTVEIPFSKTSRGKVRLQVKGSQLNLMAYTDESSELLAGDPVLVVGTEQNRLWVVSANRLDHGSNPVDPAE